MRKGRHKWWPIAAVIGLVLAASLIFLADRPAPDVAASSSREPDSAQKAAAAADKASRQSPAPAGSKSAWAIIDPDTVEELPPLEQVVADRVLVRVSEALQRGTISDRVVLSVPQLAKNYEGVIEEVDADPWGNVSYVGLLRDVDDRDYRFLITVGAINTFAHIGTSRGTFELVAIDGEMGWLMPTANMDQHVDYSKPDYYIPGEKGQRENELLP